MIKKAGLGCLCIFIFWCVLLILELWWDIFSAEFFLKISISLAILFFILLAVAVVFDQLNSDKKLKDKDYLE
ncbi:MULTISPECIES: hypothetical protein [Snodgrassella]|uniref:hypothetical protein n=1 Tax=Snodgrassella TaxID=1193515 RepID=UPI00055FC140|nr:MULTISPECIES: hypothetical protein [Snodgrassella]MBI0067291.1 hypothetical protein [Snodgrassella sp. M0110]MBI0075791.1 hypothetical protein [Snodgrassella sp. M0118]MBI0078592.1 hypothetical protein [Snodgrassella sp. M0112]MBI0180350.1 hypothetical protein [Snodgrassella sp. W8158]NUF78735.1 hypothetical protein [Snodgrassella sp. ESL0323]